MAWQVIIENLNQTADGALFANVVFVNEELGRKEPRSVRCNNASKENIYAALRGERERLSAFDDVKPDIQFGTFVDIDSTIPTPPDPPDPLRVAFFAALQQYRAISDLKTLGVLDGSQPEFATLLDELVKGYKPAYFGIA